MQRDELEQDANARGGAGSSLKRSSARAVACLNIAPSKARVNVHG